MTTNFHDPAAVEFPDDVIVLAPHDLEGRLFAAPNNTLGIGIQFRDEILGHFLVALAPSQIEGLHRFLGELMALPPDQLAALRDRAHAINGDDQ
ncbi:hypothetical protein [Mycolicibacterium celeriflavum]|uniref:Uncharacterized protein n=1 Tax=Mycolicibacterium celeriflavum TaxID=1249101 RepID=A0A1X0BZU7_MYCCF|nr:hypothetical protein [Mycolicibacterium celeriflavum]MCV7237708.1 hypothetical protein [Mycolicibacterium celeriflavum]ORA49976.1 hypothetical protein BST21_05455 [Mycolicibacterium celeriflavum]BBY42186.1 hypothetical protein MCEL_04810 [Mycolicibacterium celeriflavum]